MPQPPFDPTKAVMFDLAHGLVHLEDAPSRLLVPAEALAQLARAAGPEASAIFARALGEPLGLRVARRLSGGSGGSPDAPPGTPPGTEGTRGASIEAVIDHLGGELALAGLGSLSLERWGRAMLLLVDQSPLARDGDDLLAGVLEAALGRAAGRPLRCLVLTHDPVRVRLLVAAEAAAERARGWLREGITWGEVLARLHAPPPEARGAA